MISVVLTLPAKVRFGPRKQKYADTVLSLKLAEIFAPGQMRGPKHCFSRMDGIERLDDCP
jgi:hypothetical protein